jgi:hypothetical protein
MTTRNVNMLNGSPVQARILTVDELAAILQTMRERGQGALPVFASDARARYPLATMVTYTPSGYPECLLIRPQPHLHAEVRDTSAKCASYFADANAEADRVREACGAFA